jgi:hypothetical protein
MATREQNERRFLEWEDLPDGGRRYVRRIAGRVSGYALCIKIVDSDENTVQLVQEIYNEQGQLIGRHQKYPEDTGHEVIDPGGDEV